MIFVNDYDFDLVFWPSLMLALYSVYVLAPKDWRYRRYPAILAFTILYSVIIAGFMFLLRYTRLP